MLVANVAATVLVPFQQCKKNCKWSINPFQWITATWFKCREPGKVQIMPTRATSPLFIPCFVISTRKQEYYNGIHRLNCRLWRLVAVEKSEFHVKSGRHIHIRLSFDVKYIYMYNENLCPRTLQCVKIRTYVWRHVSTTYRYYIYTYRYIYIYSVYVAGVISMLPRECSTQWFIGLKLILPYL